MRGTPDPGDAMRRSLLAAAALLPALVTPAHAAGAVVFTCDVTMAPFGSGSGTCNAAGFDGTTGLLLGAVAMDLSARNGACRATGRGRGVLTGAVDVAFTWSYAGRSGA